MPHLILEHSRNISLKTDLKTLAKDLHYKFAEQETIKLSALKTRTIISDNVFIGDGSKSEFIYLKVLLLAGRSNELKDKFAKCLDEIIKKHIYNETCSTCIEIRDLNHYTKD